MTLEDLILLSNKRLKKAKIKTYQIDSLAIVCFVLKKDKEWIYLNKNQNIPISKIEKIKKLIRKRESAPLSYLTNEKEFYGRKFFINEDVLIPRPETEGLVELTMRELNGKRGKFSLAEIGIGSGCISITLLKELPDMIKKITATDISKNALRVAQKNSKNHRIKSKIDFLHIDILPRNKKFDLIVSNPPYIPKNTKLSKDVRKEPTKSLYEPKNFLEKMIPRISNAFKKDTIALLEIDPTQEARIKKITKNEGLEIVFQKDLWEKTRYAILKKRL